MAKQIAYVIINNENITIGRDPKGNDYWTKYNIQNHWFNEKALRPIPVVSIRLMMEMGRAKEFGDEIVFINRCTLSEDEI